MRAAALVAVLAGVVALVLIAVVALPAAADGWRAAFLLLSAPPLGAVALLLVARVVGADWDAALLPMARAVPWIALLVVPVVIGQALFHWPAGHLHLWLSPVTFALRSAAALQFWAWVARALVRGVPLPAGPLLALHGLVVSVMGYDWLLGAAPAQPNSAAPMILAVMQIGGAAALACAASWGSSAQRRDLAYLIVASALGLAYLLYMDFVIVWFGNLPAHVGWYAARQVAPAIVLPGLALPIGVLAPMVLVAIGRSDRARQIAGVCALVALAMIAIWFVAGAAGWLALFAAVAGIAAVAAMFGAAREVTA